METTTGISPVPPERRNLGGLDIGLIWFGAAIVITECWAGGLPALTGLGLTLGLVAVVLGRVVGNGLMGAMARMGAESGLPNMVLTRPAFGVRGGAFPAIMNVIQLIGWTGWMYFVGYLYLDRLASFLGLPTAQQHPLMVWVWIGALAVVCTAWAAAGARSWQILQRVAAIGLFIMTVGMTVLVLQKYSLGEVLRRPASADASFLGGVDVVVAMSVSWIPLVADYSRFSRSPRGAATGTFWGYFAGGTWMYAVGLLVALAVGPAVLAERKIGPDQMVVETLGSAGAAWAVMGIGLVLLSTVTTTFLDIYSTVVSAQNLVPRIPTRAAIAVTGLGGAVVATQLNVFGYEPFLLAIGAIFLPIFTVVLADRFLVRRTPVEVGMVDVPGGAYWYVAGLHVAAFVAWLAGFLVYDALGGFASIGFFLPGVQQSLSGVAEALDVGVGSSLPCILVTALVYLALAHRPRAEGS